MRFLSCLSNHIMLYVLNVIIIFVSDLITASGAYYCGGVHSVKLSSVYYTNVDIDVFLSAA